MNSVVVEVLGPLQVVMDGTVHEVRSTPQRLVLTSLALETGGTVSVAKLIDVVWGEDPPKNPRGALQVVVSKLRRVIGAETILTDPVGYRLADGVSTDVARVEELLESPGRDELEQALALWRGEALAEVGEGSELGPERVRLRALRRRIELDLLAERLRRDDPEALLPELEASAAVEPFNERVALLQVEALHRTGRSAEAAKAAAEFRKRLAEASGLSPSVAFEVLEADVLSGSALDRPLTGVRLPSPPVLLGRARDLTRLENLTQANWLTTVVGPGGVGKTSLVSVWSDNRSDATAVELHHMADGGDVAANIAHQIGLEARGSDPRQALLDHLATVSPVLVLDNCEHVISAVRDLVEAIRRWAPTARVVCTSRQRLGIHGEQVMQLEPLLVPKPGMETTKTDAVRLFAERASQANPDIEIGDDQLAAVAAICRAVDGLPLAIELAAARAPIFGVEELAHRVESDIGVLEQGGGRHRSLGAVLDWSIGLLDPEAAQVLVTSALFDGNFRVESLEATHGDADVVPPLGRLVESNLVLRVAGNGPARFRLHVPTRLHVVASQQRPDGVERRFVEWARRLVVGLSDQIGFPGEGVARDRAFKELANIRGAVRIALSSGDTPPALAIAEGLGTGAYTAGNAELYSIIEMVAEAVEPDHGVAAVGPLAASARAASMQGRWHVARARAEAASGMFEEVPESYHMAEHALAVAAYYAGDYQEAERRYQQISTDVRVALPWRLTAEFERGAAIARGGDVAGGRVVTATALEQAEAEAGETVVAWGTYVLGSIELVPNPDEALRMFDLALERAEASRAGLAKQLAGVGRVVALYRGRRYEAAAAAVPAVLDELGRHGNRTHLLSLARVVCLLALEQADIGSASALAAAIAQEDSAPSASAVVDATPEFDRFVRSLEADGSLLTRSHERRSDLRELARMMSDIVDSGDRSSIR